MRKCIDDDEVVVVAARNAYPEYLRRSVYVCQPNRSFRDGLTRMGFYANGAIQRPLPRIRYREDLVTFTRQEAAARRSGSAVDRQIGEVIELLLADGPARRVSSTRCSCSLGQRTPTPLASTGRSSTTPSASRVDPLHGRGANATSASPT